MSDNRRAEMWAAFRAEIQALSTEDLAALIASFEADAEPGLDDAKLSELYEERDRRAEMCRCGHPREAHDDTPRPGYRPIGCGVVVRPDGTGCRCRGFCLDTGRQKGDDDGVGYADPRDRAEDEP